jgi:hypothetical protein
VIVDAQDEDDRFEFLDAHLALRAPRVAIVVDDDDLWRDRASLALYAASRVWGGCCTSTDQRLVTELGT